MQAGAPMAQFVRPVTTRDAAGAAAVTGPAETIVGRIKVEPLGGYLLNLAKDRNTAVRSRVTREIALQPCVRVRWQRATPK